VQTLGKRINNVEVKSNNESWFNLTDSLNKFLDILRLMNKSTNATLKYCYRVQRTVPTMVYLDKEMFYQVLMLLVNLMIRDLNNLDLISILIQTTGQSLEVRISYHMLDI